MHRAFLSVGSNIDPERNVPRALRQLARAVRVVAISTFYRTGPCEGAGGSSFINGIVAVDTTLPPRELKHGLLRGIESALGRHRTSNKNAPRAIDLDLLLYGDRVLETVGLVIPDPLITSRPFLAVPLFELAPDLSLPGSRMRLCEIARNFSGHSMEPLAAFTALLRRELMVPGVTVQES